MKKFYFFILAVIAFTLQANADVIMTKPDGTSKMYERSGGLSYIFDGSTVREQNQYGFTEIIFDADGTTVYIQDPISGFKVEDEVHTYIKGTIGSDGKTLTFPLTQHIWTDEDGSKLMVAVFDKDESSHNISFVPNTSIKEVTYTMTDNKIVLNGTSKNRILGIMSNFTGQWINYGDYNTEYTEYEFADPVTPPDGLDLKKCKLSAMEHLTELWYSTEVTVGFDGNDVYIKGLDKFIPDAWVKGTVDGRVVIVPIQYMGQDPIGRHHFLVGWNVGVGGVADLKLNYYKDMDALEATAPVVINSNPTMISYYVYYSSLFIGDRPDPVSAPDDIEYQTLKMKGSNDILGFGRADEFERNVKVGIKDGTVYFQGLSETIPDAWAAGKLENGKVTIPQGQFIGVGETSAVYLIGADGDTGVLKDYVFSYDEANNIYSSEDILYECSVMVPSSFLIKYLPGVVISEDSDNPDVNPDDLPAVTYTFTGKCYDKATSTTSTVEKTVYVAVSGKYVFLKGMCDLLPNAWARGVRTDATVTFKDPQKLGTVDGTDYYFSGLDVMSFTLTDCVLSYNEASGKYTFVTSAVINKSDVNLDYTHWYYSDSVLTPESLGVESVEVDSDEEEVIYNMQGIRVSRPLSSGLYIINGKKVLVR